jgi:ABC-type branched-subunit amino acid transport system substrate-binding protein
MVALAALFAACGGGTATPGSSGNNASYKLTIDTDFSGPNAAGGVAAGNGFQAYFDELDAHGGAGGHHVDLVVMDDRSDVPTALANYQQTVASDSLGFMAMAASAVIAAVSPKAIQDGIVTSNNGGYNQGVGVFPYIFNENPTGPTFFAAVSSFAAAQVSHPQGAKAAFIAYDSALVESYQPAIGRALTGKGFDVAYSQLVPATNLDFGVASGNIAAASPAIIVTDLRDSQIVPFVTAIRARSYTGPIINFGSDASSGSMKKLDDPKMYLVQYTADPLDTKDPDVAHILQVASQYKLTTGTNSLFYIENWMMAKVAAAAIAKCGDKCTRDSFASALERTTVPGGTLMAGNPGFSPTNHVMTQKVVIDQWNESLGYLSPIKGYGF